MTEDVVRAVLTTQAAASSQALHSWGRKPDDNGSAETSGESLLEQDGLPVVGVTGVWESTPGSWGVDARPLTEVAFILGGRGQVVDSDGTTHDLTPGVVIVLPVGWSGRWVIEETLRKFYVVAPGPKT